MSRTGEWKLKVVFERREWKLSKIERRDKD
ncbi:hypothetical protein COLO4_16071 [Corchorus olitorius]|uniref:Uncharacterized protein n=1 Tax=Corchorus olitorius TaxID=93759 RepID=A0A1R3JK07_9ROSI|nr:hypothetical protein COLO4_16071 [Corchorus olitorius]